MTTTSGRDDQQDSATTQDVVARIAVALRRAFEAHPYEFVCNGYDDNDIRLDGHFDLNALAHAALSAIGDE